MKYLIFILIIFFVSCNDSNNVNNFLEEEKIIPTEISNDKIEEDNKLILEIQMALKERGYDIEVTGDFNQETRNAFF